MEYTTLGKTGTNVSRLCLGCDAFGSSDPWKLDPDDAHEIIDRAIELGINFFDTANVYSSGESEQILGDAIEEYDRDELVIGTKVGETMDETDPNGSGLSRKAIETEIAGSLDRLGIDTVDLYQIHRWDYQTPIEETLRTMSDLVRRGRVRYLGASSMWAYQFGDIIHACDRLGMDPFVSMQNHYTLPYREEEREMIPLCENEGVGLIPWSPLGRGYLTRPDTDETTTNRERTDEYIDEHVSTYRQAGGKAINERVEELASDYGVSMAQIALAWHLHKEPVDAPILGTTSVRHLEDAVEAIDIDLTSSEISYLEEPYRPVNVFRHE
ncbi:aldo/keto reductase [Halopenitus sp. H-Gu1]|uniref:aldo/keto reductase n=1 Tax=Halopenitus sp. H-Gu1 TaxID=3242697 RepID=UPI00359F02E1